MLLLKVLRKKVNGFKEKCKVYNNRSRFRGYGNTSCFVTHFPVDIQSNPFHTPFKKGAAYP